MQCVSSMPEMLATKQPSGVLHRDGQQQQEQ
jgi:hypothetical protein